jgi:tRNA-binding protein
MKEFTPAPIKPVISHDDFAKLDMRIGRIEEVEDVPGTNKLVKLIVSFGEARRTILTGMKQERANPAELRGRQAIFLVNLAPRKMFGEISEGMILDIGYADGLTPVLAVPEEAVPTGTRIG